MTWDEAAGQGPNSIAFRIDHLGVLYFRHHHGTEAILLGRPFWIENIYDDCTDWRPFQQDSLTRDRLREVQQAHFREWTHDRA